MYKLYKHDLALNPLLLVNPLATIRPRYLLSMDPSPKKDMKTPSLEVKISIIENPQVGINIFLKKFKQISYGKVLKRNL